ncbi:MAG: FKBP-type peptidyl-prolyl cis-trans isomerase [Opitutaceae bacterium]|nr:FKBP-type peptidyl-prolyl cis-trans isomerase [Opitutaceae bacterium]
MSISFLRLWPLLLLATLAAAPLHAQREKLPLEDLEFVEKKWPDARRTGTGLRYIVLNEGDKNSAMPVPGMMVSTLYKGMLLDGTVFDEALDPAKPLRIRLGRGNLIDGWEEALQQMHKGEKRLLIVPAELGYGTRGRAPTIPRNATLIFEVELLDFEGK